MRYISTRGGDAPVNFQDVVLGGLARDGGLYLPESVPDVRRDLEQWRRLSYQELAFEIMRLYADLPTADLRGIINRAYARFAHPDIAPVQRVGDLFLLELFHGPTLAFKDLALQFLGGLFEYYLAAGGGRLNILAATSGDTGSAAIHGVRGRAHIRIFVLYPHGRVSPAQERQMITVPDANVFTLALQGDFDDCQRIVKTVFGDLDFRDRHALGAVNSINWARILAQMVYYFHAAFRVMDATGADKVRFAVPTGNFGDIFAGYLAWRMGLPIRQLILATNENDILARFFNTGIYQPAQVKATVSPSMDIQVASNFERYLFYRLNGNAMALRKLMHTFSAVGRLTVTAAADPVFRAGSADKAATLAAIRRYHARHAFLLDPHTAAGVSVAEQFRGECEEPVICLATAHPAKFADAIRAAIDEDPPAHPMLALAEQLPQRRTVMPADVKAVKEYIRART